MKELGAQMNRTLRRCAALAAPLLISVSAALAQAADCPAFVDQAINAVSDRCGTMGRNTVCYGNTSIDAEFSRSIDDAFAAPGDTASVIHLQRLATAPLTPEQEIWGVAVLALQADLPDVAAGQNVTFIVFGDAEVTPEDAAPGYEAPMQAFRLDTHFTGINCQDVPESGMLVQAPEATTVSFQINGVEVKVGSTAMLQVDGEDLAVSTIEGFVEVTSDGAMEVAGQGTTVRIPRGRRPLRAALTRARQVLLAPWRLLPRRTRAMPPPPEGQVVSLNDCLYTTAPRSAESPVRILAGEPVALRFTIPISGLALARTLQQQARTTVSINGEPLEMVARIGPWRGSAGEYNENYGMELYWLSPALPVGTARLTIDITSLDGQPINTGVDGPDPDRRPEIIPARRRLFCALEAGGS